MKRLFYIYVLTCFLTGCSLGAKVSYLWQGQFLKVDTDISKKKWKLSSDEKKLIETFYKFDAELDYLTNSLQKLSDSNFEIIGEEKLINRPWVLGVYLFEGIDHQINLKKQTGEKPSIEPEKLINKLPRSKNSMSFIFLENKAILTNFQKKGQERYELSAIFLDIKKLALYKCNLLQRFAILTNNFIVINNGIDKSDISKINWNSLLKDKNKGIIQINKKHFYWMGRFLADKPIYYLIKI